MSDAPKRPSTVIDGGTPTARLNYTSVSALQKLRSCRKKYALRYVAKLPDPPGKGAERGTEGHARIKHYGLTGENVLDPLEQLGIDKGFIPRDPLHPRFEWEREFDGEVTVFGVPLVGAIDLVEVRGPEATSATITDWKFKKSIDSYAAKKEDLIDVRTDEGLQMLGYVAAVSVRYPALIEVGVAHVTFQTQGRAEVVRTKEIVRVSDARELFGDEAARLVAEAKEVIKLDPYTVEPPPDPPCDKYGGCKYRDTCWSPAAKIQRLFNKKANNAAPNRESEGLNMGFIGKITLPSKAVEAPKVDAPKVDAPKAEAPKAEAKAEIPPLPANALPDVLPPDAPKSDPLAKPGGTKAEVPKPTVPQNEAQTVAALQASIAAAPAAEPEKPKRGRPRKANIVDVSIGTQKTDNVTFEPASRTKAAEVVMYEPAAVAATEEKAVAPAVKGTPEKEEAAPAGFFLYFGCSPVGVPTTTLHAYVNEIDAGIREAAQLKSPDLRADASNEYGFGKWRGFMAAVAQQHPPAPGHYVVTSGDERVSVVAEALIPLAALVVSGGGR